ncbi:nitroreductase/quinone reductase family protein [Actinomadura decatromicini]|uniref:Nitroreductase family deazaflavin-dependent oxidoreductase n=1 Tax=Actinomadura decatromicini TaxID=2604572 RepID=A0A5D3FJ19_9ACTN|nr:nitroreductase/quinone reductase family protein [Actinomadura decatromicini]TYK47896.1 nitroreductase family deazaflavin-dependent oxidoreductase [Actinomadura decatromicini]
MTESGESDLLVLVSTGRRSGRRHRTELAYLADGDRLHVFASNAGSPHDPDWYRNVRADPRVVVEMDGQSGGETFDGVAFPVEGAERDELFARQSARHPAYAEYQRMTDRVIPVVEIHRGFLDGRAWALGDELVKIHDGLRADLAALRAGVRGFRRGAAPDLAAQLREHCVSVCDVLGRHHDNEEGRAFPRLEREFPGLAPVLGRLRREHVAVTENRRRLEKLIADPASRDLAHVGAELDRMADELDAHFAYEEEQLRALLNAVGPRWRPGHGPGNGPADGSGNGPADG